MFLARTIGHHIKLKKKPLTNLFLEKESEDDERETDADGDAGGVVEDDIAAQRRSVEEEQQPESCHADLKFFKIFTTRVNIRYDCTFFGSICDRKSFKI